MEKETVIVFFSKDGNTKLGAQLLGQQLNAEIIQLKEEKKGNFIQAIFKKASRLIGEPQKEIADFKSIYLMLPIWASNGVPAMNAFLAKADFTGKNVYIITFQQFTDLKNSDKVHKHIGDIVLKKGGIIKNSYALLGEKMGHCATEEFIKNQIMKIQV